jgi:hypothetical protein
MTHWGLLSPKKKNPVHIPDEVLFDTENVSSSFATSEVFTVVCLMRIPFF